MASSNNKVKKPKPYAIFVIKTLRVKTFEHEEDWRAACAVIQKKNGKFSFEAMKYSQELKGYYKLEQFNA